MRFFDELDISTIVHIFFFTPDFRDIYTNMHSMWMTNNGVYI